MAGPLGARRPEPGRSLVLRRLGACVFVIGMTVSGATAGGAVMTSCAGAATWERERYGYLRTEPEADAAERAVQRETRAPATAAFGLVGWVALLFALRRSTETAAAATVVVTATATGIASGVAAIWIGNACSLGDPTWAALASLGGALLGAPCGFVAGAVLEVATYFARRAHETGTPASLERSLVATGLSGCLAAGCSRVLPDALAALPLAVGLLALGGGLGSFAQRKWRLHWLRSAPIGLLPLDAADHAEATSLSDGAAAWAVVDRDTTGYRDRPKARWLLGENDAAALRSRACSDRLPACGTSDGSASRSS